MTLWGGSSQQLSPWPPSNPPSPLAYPTSLMEMTIFCTVTTEVPSSTMTREMLPSGPRRNWTLKVDEASLQVAAKM